MNTVFDLDLLGIILYKKNTVTDSQKNLKNQYYRFLEIMSTIYERTIALTLYKHNIRKKNVGKNWRGKSISKNPVHGTVRYEPF